MKNTNYHHDNDRPDSGSQVSEIIHTKSFPQSGTSHKVHHHGHLHWPRGRLSGEKHQRSQSSSKLSNKTSHCCFHGEEWGGAGEKLEALLSRWRSFAWKREAWVSVPSSSRQLRAGQREKSQNSKMSLFAIGFLYGHPPEPQNRCPSYMFSYRHV